MATGEFRELTNVEIDEVFGGIDWQCILMGLLCQILLPGPINVIELPCEAVVGMSACM